MSAQRSPSRRSIQGFASRSSWPRNIRTRVRNTLALSVATCVGKGRCVATSNAAASALVLLGLAPA
eukprot:7219807-Alexandrium_andersonii.AAC.1